MLGALHNLTATELVKRYNEALEIDVKNYDANKKAELESVCKEFLHFSKQIIPILKTMVTHIALYMSTKSQSI